MRWIITFAEGLLSFASPCTLPLIPLYVTYFAAGKSGRGHAIIGACCFAAGFTIVFVLLGALSGTLGMFLLRIRTGLFIALGVSFVLYGLFLWDLIRLPMPRLKIKDFDVRSLTGAFGFGMAFSLLLTPCAGAYLAAALNLATVSGSVGIGVALLAVYSLGLAIPFLLCAALTEQVARMLAAVRRRAGDLRHFCGTCMILMGILTACGLLNASFFTF
ncbi:MAG: cytochrome c biogenesis protein CcdA [Clostridia bacterium]|nr:cytochrome c biogenesis protein CcdA [Clostridia bacterium]